MSRRSVLIFAGSVALAAAIIGLWIPWNNPCIQIIWNDGPRSYIETFDTPYGARTCDHFPSDTERCSKAALLVISLMPPAAFVGRSAARFSVLLGGGAVALGLLAAAAFWYWVPTYEYVAVIDKRFFTPDMLLPLGVAFIVGMLGAVLGRYALHKRSLERDRRGNSLR